MKMTQNVVKVLDFVAAIYPMPVYAQEVSDILNMRLSTVQDILRRAEAYAWLRSWKEPTGFRGSARARKYYLLDASEERLASVGFVKGDWYDGGE